MDQNSIKYRPELDGLRAIAVAMVIAFHAKVLQGGYIGVDVFFVLSGYLITSILLRELSLGKINIKRFYYRRFLRLTPSLTLFLILYLGFSLLAWPYYQHHLRDALISFLYLSDYSYALYRVPKFIRHTWSLAVEEHYYLIWPFVLIVIYRMPRTAFILFFCYIFASFWRINSLNLDYWLDAYFRFDMRLSGLLLGSMLAMLQLRQQLQYLSWSMPALLLFGFSSYYWGWKSKWGLTVGVASAEISTALIIASGVKGFLVSKPLTYIGKLSYGLYLYHYPIIYYLRDITNPWTTLAAGSALSFMLAAISYHTVEAWIRQYKKSP